MKKNWQRLCMLMSKNGDLFSNFKRPMWQFFRIKKLAENQNVSSCIVHRAQMNWRSTGAISWHDSYEIKSKKGYIVHQLWIIRDWALWYKIMEGPMIIGVIIINYCCNFIRDRKSKSSSGTFKYKQINITFQKIYKWQKLPLTQNFDAKSARSTHK